jgi:hypothetical protein
MMFKHKTLWLIAFAVVPIAVWLWPDNEQPKVNQAHVDLVPTPKPVTVEVVPEAEIGQIMDEEKGNLPEEKAILPEEVETKFNETMQVQLSSVVQAYEQNIHYPSYTVPLNEKSWDLRHPQSFVDNHLPIEGVDGVEAALSLPKYIIFVGDPLQVNLTLKSKKILPPLNSLTVEVLENQMVVGQIPMKQTQHDNSLIRFRSEYYPTQSEVDQWGQELQIRASISMGESETLLVSAFQYAHKCAQLLGARKSYLEGPNLIIPLEFEVHQPGRYQVRANLYDKMENPISHLIMKASLGNEENLVLLKVHSQILRDRNAPGPYILREFNITKLPSKPGEITKYAASNVDQIEVDGFELNLYDDTPYVNEEAKKHLDFLKQLAGQ